MLVNLAANHVRLKHLVCSACANGKFSVMCAANILVVTENQQLIDVVLKMMPHIINAHNALLIDASLHQSQSISFLLTLTQPSYPHQASSLQLIHYPHLRHVHPKITMVLSLECDS